MVNRIGQFFADRALLSLVTLMVFSGLLLALVPVAWTYAKMAQTARPSANEGTKGAGARPLDASSCDRLVVSFTSAAPIGQITALLSSMNASIAYGPDENSAFEVSVPAGEAAATASALSRAEAIVLSASPRAGCP